MRRKRYILALIVLCFAEIILIQVEPLLESYDYPLVSSLTCALRQKTVRISIGILIK